MSGLGENLLPRTDRGRYQTRGGEWFSVRHYELMVILDPELEERTVAPSLETFLNVVRTAGGTVEKVEIWGRRRLAYEIKKKAEGIYAVVEITCRAGRRRRARPPAEPERVGAAHQGPAPERKRVPEAAS